MPSPTPTATSSSSASTRASTPRRRRSGATGPRADPAAVCVAYLAAFATGDPELVLAHVADGFVNEHTAALGEGSVGIDEYRRRLPGFIASMPDLRYEIEDVVATRDRVVIPYTLRARVSGREIAVRGVMRFVVGADGLICRRVDYWDSEVFRRQAGLG